jgi:hypothetical protein
LQITLQTCDVPLSHQKYIVKPEKTGMNLANVAGTVNANHAAKCLNIFFTLIIICTMIDVAIHTGRNTG